MITKETELQLQLPNGIEAILKSQGIKCRVKFIRSTGTGENDGKAIWLVYTNLSHTNIPIEDPTFWAPWGVSEYLSIDDALRAIEEFFQL